MKTTAHTLIHGTHAEYLATYAKFRDDIMEHGVQSWLTMMAETKLEDLHVDDQITFIAAKAMIGIIDDIQSLTGKVSKANMKKLVSKKQWNDLYKWCMTARRQCASLGTLQACWNGLNLNGKAKEVFAKHDAKYGQSKVAVTEHPYPTKWLKEGMFTKAFHTPLSLLKYVVRRNFVSYTSAPEDNSLTKTELPWKAFFSRYDDAGVKVFVLNEKWPGGPDASDVMKRMMKECAQAKKDGLSFEEWVASIIEL